MSAHYLSHTFDIHGGGMDLIFPHHENEIAQSCAACPDSNINFWVHNGFVNVDDLKMSKSLGNFFTIREVKCEIAFVSFSPLSFFLFQIFGASLKFSRGSSYCVSESCFLCFAGYQIVPSPCLKALLIGYAL